MKNQNIIKTQTELNQNIPNQVFKQSLSGIYIGMIINKAGN